MNPLNEALPTGVVTVTIPDDPLATTAVTVVADTIVSELAIVPPKVTEVASVKFVPVIVTVVPLTAVVGVKDVMAGAGKNVKSPSVAEPSGVVTSTTPVEPDPTMAVMLVDDTTVKELAAIPPNVTDVAPLRFVPVIFTVVPLLALVGVNDVMEGPPMNTYPFKAPVPPGPVTDTLPDEPLPTVAIILVDDTTVNDAAAVTPNLTTVASVKLVPLIVTVAPAPEVVGVNEVTVGAGM